MLAGKPPLIHNPPMSDTQPDKPLTPYEEAFAQGVIKWHGNQTRAWRELNPNSKGTDKSQWESASEIATRPKVKERIRELQALQAASAIDVVREVVAKARRIVEADSSALIQTRIGCCRHCHGEGHKYQRTEREYLQAWDAYARALDAVQEGELAPLPFEDGGTGYDLTREPHPDCPECGGEGIPREVLPDTRHLSPDAALLYAGVKRTKNGIEVLAQDKRAWAELLMKWAGAYVEKRELSGPGGVPLATTSATISVTATPEEAARIYADMVKGNAP